MATDAYWQSIQDEMAQYNQPSYYQPYPTSPSGGGTSPFDVADSASSLNDAWQLAGIGGGGSGATAAAGGAGQLTAPGALTPGAVTTEALGATTGGVSGGAPSMSAALPYLPMAAILGLGAFGGVPSGKDTWQTVEKARAERNASPYLDYLRSQAPAGMDYGEYVKSKMPPMAPMERTVRALDRGSSGDKGDRQYNEEEILNQMREPARQAEMSKYYADNPLWFNADGTRTDYSGQYAPSLSAQKQSFSNTFPKQGLFGGETKTQPMQSLTPMRADTRTGNIYGQDVPRQTFNGQDLYADQTLQNPMKYKGY